MAATKKKPKLPEPPWLKLDLADVFVLHDIVEEKFWELANWLYQENDNTMTMADRAKKLGIPYGVALLVDERRDLLACLSNQLEAIGDHGDTLSFPLVIEHKGD